MRMNRSFLFSLLAGFCLVSLRSFAQQSLVPKEEIKSKEKTQLGWNNTANLGFNLSFASSQGVIGQIDGQTQTYGLNLKGEFDKVETRSEWRSTASYLGSASRTPSLDRYTKSNDELKLESIFLYSLPSAPDFGPYVKGSVLTSLFKGEDLRATPVVYNVTNQDGSTATVAGDTFRLTDSLRPLTTSESVGGFWKPVHRDDLRVETRLGFGAQQINSHGQYTVTGTGGGTGNVVGVNVSELRDVNQAGLEAAVIVKGKLDEKSSYETSVESLTPFINDKRSNGSRDALRLTNVDGRIKLTSNITSWASFSYDYKLILQPQLVDRTQQSHLIVLNVNYNLL